MKGNIYTVMRGNCACVISVFGENENERKLIFIMRGNRVGDFLHLKGVQLQMGARV